MKFKLSLRDREIIGTATKLYEKLAESTLKDLEELALPTVAVQTALGNIGVIRERLGTTSDTSEDVELQPDLRITVNDALELMSTRVEKVKTKQLKLAIATNDVEIAESEIRDLQRELADQMVLV